ncbi:hypothetical protein HK098_005995 [Nowakowskiella sp. JEL0407]|nr:hypothetical protein HK098_005995 [Nowakowskiella sp. JEL0407]
MKIIRSIKASEIKKDVKAEIELTIHPDISESKKETSGKRMRSVDHPQWAFSKNGCRRRRLRQAVKEIIRNKDVYEDGFACLFSESDSAERIEEKVIKRDILNLNQIYQPLKFRRSPHVKLQSLSRTLWLLQAVRNYRLLSKSGKVKRRSNGKTRKPTLREEIQKRVVNRIKTVRKKSRSTGSTLENDILVNRKLNLGQLVDELPFPAGELESFAKQVPPTLKVELKKG